MAQLIGGNASTGGPAPPSGITYNNVGIVLPQIYTFATLPAATLFPIGTQAFTSDDGPVYINMSQQWTQFGTGGGGGSVTSVGVTSSTLTVTGSPITSSGNIEVDLSTATQTSLSKANSALQSIAVNLTSTGGSLTLTNGTGIGATGTANLDLAVQAGIVAGTYTNPNVSVNQYGVVTAVTNGSGGGGGGSGSSGILYFSQAAGVTVNSTTDNNAALVAALATVRASGQLLVVDFNPYIAVGTDRTKVIFVQSNTNVYMLEGNYWITDQMGCALFWWYYAVDCHWHNAFSVKYIGTPGVTIIDQQNPTWVWTNTNNDNPLNFNDTTAKTFLSNLYTSSGGTQGNQFSGAGSNLFSAATNASAMITFAGACDRCVFTGHNRIFVPDNAPACNFVMCAINLQPAWNSGITVTSAIQSGPIYPGVATIPQHITIRGLELDGVCMGVVGTAAYLDIDVIGKRYSDIQDANGHNVGGQYMSPLTLASAPGSGATTANLATTWPGSTKTYTCVFVEGNNVESKIVSFTSGSTALSWSGGLAAGAGTTMYAGFSQYWCAPPHLLYLHSWGQGVFPMLSKVKAFDYGNYVGTPNRRGTGSGYINTIKVEPASGSDIDVTTNRPDGCTDILAFGLANGTVKMKSFLSTDTATIGQLTFTGTLNSGATNGNMTSMWEYNSGTAVATFSTGQTITVNVTQYSTYVTWSTALSGSANAIVPIRNTQQQANFGCRFPAVTPIIDLNIDMEVTDLSNNPVNWPIQSAGNGLNQGIRGKWKATVQDWPYSATYVPSFGLGGYDHVVQYETIFNNCTSPTANVGFIDNTGTTEANNCHFDHRVVGWRTTNAIPFTGTSQAVTFATTLPAGSVGGNLTSNWSNPTGYYSTTFSDSEVRLVLYTNGSTSVSWITALSGAATTSATAYYVASGATSATLSMAWPYASGVFRFVFSDNEIRFVTCTNNSTAVTWTNGLTGVCTTGVSIYAINTNTFDNMKPRVLLMQAGISIGTVATSVDATNGIIQDIKNGIYREQWCQTIAFSPTGTSYDTGISVPTRHAIMAFGYKITGSLVGPSTINIGWSGFLTNLVNGGAVALNTNPYTNPTNYPIAVAATSDILVSAASSITGGSMYIAVVSESSQVVN